MSDTSDALFETMLTEAGMPVTEEDMAAQWKQINEDEGSLITNDSAWSPFWRLITAIVTTPLVQFVKLLIKTALPNLFLKYASGTWLDIYAWGVDLERKDATYAEGVLLFTRESAAGTLTIPEGTVVKSPAIDDCIYSVAVTADTTCPDGTLAFSVPVKATGTGDAYNLGPGYYCLLVAAIAGIVSVTNESDWQTTPGADEESDEELRLRCRNQFSAVGQFHHDAAYKAIISEYAGIRTDYLYFEHDAPRGPGTANCYILLETGAPPQSYVDDINAYVSDNGYHGHGDSMLCYPMPTTEYSLTATVYPVDNLDDEAQEALRQAVEDMIRCAFRENTDYDLTLAWPQSRFSFSQLDRDLHDGLENLLSVVFDRTDDIVSEMDLPVLADGGLSVVLAEAA